MRSLRQWRRTPLQLHGAPASSPLGGHYTARVTQSCPCRLLLEMERKRKRKRRKSKHKSRNSPLTVDARSLAFANDNDIPDVPYCTAVPWIREQATRLPTLLFFRASTDGSVSTASLSK